MKTISFYRVSVKKRPQIFSGPVRVFLNIQKRSGTKPDLFEFVSFYNNLVFKRLAKLSSSSKELY